MTPEELARRANLTPATLHRLLAEYQYAMSDEMSAAMHNAPDDPIAAQFIPDARELTIAASELADPIGDAPHSPLPSLVHRYPNRVLWKISPVCAVYCRFCFRKEHIGRRGQALRQSEIAAVSAYLAANPQIEEIILSGGDPLTLSNKKLRQNLAIIRDLPHIRRLRIHSRIPNARAALHRLRTSGVMLYSQTVLLKGVNADAATLANLMNDLLDCGVKPYYLHHLDLARGTGHYRVSLNEGRAIVAALRRRLSGIAMPTYIVEIPGGDGKIPVGELTSTQEAELRASGIY